MSSGIPISIVDGDAPPAASGTGHGHGHGHSRSRGHSRSTRPMQVPSPISVPPSSLMAEMPSLQPIASAGSAYTNGHASHPSWQGHHHSHSQGSVQFRSLTSSPVKSVFHDDGMDRDGEPDSPELTTKPGTSHSNEVMAGLLISLPWIALSWFSTGFTRLETSLVDDDVDATIDGSLEGKAGKACALTACAIILLGCGQIFRQGQQKSSPGALEGVFSKFNATTASTAFTRLCSIGLPIYAGLKIGGFLVAFALSLALAAGLPTAQTKARDQFAQKKCSLALLATVILVGYFGGNSALDQTPFMGYVVLLVGVFVIRPPFTVDHPGSTPEIGLGLSVGRDSLLLDKLSAASSPEDAIVNVLSGLALALVTVILSGFPSPSLADLLSFGATAASLAVSLLYSSTSALRSPQKFGHAAGMGAAALLCSPELYDDLFVPYIMRSALAAASFLAARLDDRHLRIGAHSHGHHHHHHHSHSHSHGHPSKITKMILHACEDYPLLHSILKESDSRRIFYFMTLNFSFMIVQLSYGILTGSLGLLSDSIHMFFDCLALVVGLCAAVMSKWPPSFRFPYGYGKVDTLSGFANGIFLMIISIEIIYEAVERLSSGSQMNRIGELLIVSIAGLLVNLVGIMAFDHGHAHGHDHGHDHGHSHGNENMHGIFLHILADTLGSVAVVISTILVHFSGWAGYDPIASCLIAILIFASAVPLVTSTAKTLLLTLPADVEYNLRDTLGGVSALRGVAGYSAPKFWLDDTSTGDDHHHDDHHGHDHHGHSHGHSHGHNHSHSHSHVHGPSEKHNHCADHDHHDHDDHGKHSPRVLGVIHVIASRGADLEDVRQRTVDYLREKNMNITVQVEREGDGRCWCGGGNKI